MSWILHIKNEEGPATTIEYGRLVDLAMKVSKVDFVGTPWFVVNSETPKKVWRSGNLDKLNKAPAPEAGAPDVEESIAEVEYIDESIDIDATLSEMNDAIGEYEDDHAEQPNEQIACFGDGFETVPADTVGSYTAYTAEQQTERHPILLVLDQEMVKMLRDGGFIGRHDRVSLHKRELNSVCIFRDQETITIEREAEDEFGEITGDALHIWPKYGKVLNIDDHESYDS